METTASNSSPVEETTVSLLVYGEHIAHNAQEAIARCPFLSKMPVEQAEVLLQLLPEQPQGEPDKKAMLETKTVEPDVIEKNRPQPSKAVDLARNSAVAESQTEYVEAASFQPQLVQETVSVQPVLRHQRESVEPTSSAAIPEEILAEHVETEQRLEGPQPYKPHPEQEIISPTEPIIPPEFDTDLWRSKPAMIEVHPEQESLAASTASAVEDLQTPDYTLVLPAESAPKPELAGELPIASTDVDVYDSTRAIDTMEFADNTEAFEPLYADEPTVVFAAEYTPAPDSLSEYPTIAFEETSSIEDQLLPIETPTNGQNPVLIAREKLLPENFLGTTAVLSETGPDVPIQEAREAVTEVIELLAQTAEIQQETEKPLTQDEVEAIANLLQSLNVQEPVRAIAQLNEKYEASEVRDIILRDLRELIQQIDTQFYLLNLLASSANPVAASDGRLRRIGGILYQFTHRHSHAFTFGV